MQSKPRDLTPVEYFICGGFSGMCNVSSGHAFDTVKVRLQTSDKYKGPIDCVIHTLKYEGPQGLFKGLVAPTVGAIPSFAVIFFGFGIGKKIFEVHREDYKILRITAAGAFAGLLGSFVLAPIERMKCLLQIQTLGGNKIYDGPIDVFRKLHTQGGTPLLYRGLVATIIREIPANSAFFVTYTLLNKPGEKQSTLTTLFAGGLAGVAKWTMGMPGDTLKSRLQTAPDGQYPQGFRQVFVELMRKEGPTALYTGFQPVILRAIVANAALFFSFELIAKGLRIFRPINGTLPVRDSI